MAGRFSRSPPLTSSTAIERLFATDVFATGAGFYYTDAIVDNSPAYKGPYKDPSGNLKSIETPDAPDDRLPPERVDTDVRLPDVAAGQSPRSSSRRTPASRTPTRCSPTARTSSAATPRASRSSGSATTPTTQKTDDVRKPLVDKVTITIYAERRRRGRSTEGRGHRPRGRWRRAVDVPGADRGRPEAQGQRGQPGRRASPGTWSSFQTVAPLTTSTAARRSSTRSTRLDLRLAPWW